MRFLKNRTVLGVLCIVLSLIICFAVTPLFNKAMSEKTEIVRVVKPISVGEEITSDMVKTIEVGSYNLPDDVVKHSDTVVGAFASADLAPGDYILTSKIAEEPAAENAYLYHLTGEKQAISVTVKAFANGLSGKLKSGDIVSVIAPDYRKQGKTVIPAELQYVEVIAVTANSGYDANTGEELEGEKLQDALNAMWRNRCINDTYEPGSTFKIITSAACLEEGVVTPEDTFSCPGYRMVEDRRIRCHKVGGHGSETFVQGIQNSCNPVFIDIGLRLGAERFYDYFQQFGLLDLTGIDLPGEAGTIMHQVENIGLVELATISFGQSFQVTPVQMAVTVSSIINGGRRVTPHFGKAVLDREGNVLETLSYEERSGVVSEKTSKTMQTLLEGVVANGSGKNAYIEGYSIGGKTATSQTLPRSANKYISSFIGFAPAEDPQVLGMVVIHNPQGIYYGGTIAAPVLRSIFDNVLPYLGIEKQ